MQLGYRYCLYPSNGKPENSDVHLRKKCMQPEAKIKLVGLDFDAPVKMEFYKLGDNRSFFDLDTHGSFPSHPNSIGWLDNMVLPSNIDTQFVARLTTYFVPPITGNYNFTLTVDDIGEIYIGNVPGVPGQSDLKKLIQYSGRQKRFEVLGSDQISESVHLVGGEKYFLKARYIEMIEVAHMTIGVILPNGERVIPITSRYLSRDACK